MTRGTSTIRLKEPYPTQVAFLKAKARYVAYGGARGGGKSEAARMKAVLLALKNPGVQILFLRRLLTDLRENHLMPLLSMLSGAAVYRGQTKEFLFPNGSRIVLGHCDAERDVLKYQGQSYDVIFMEEATQFTEDQYNLIKLSLRPSGLAKHFTPRMYLTCNPGGVGHGWVKRLFISRQYKDKERPEDYIFIPAKVYDNKFIMETDREYVRQLENLPETQRKAYLDGNWDVFEGQYFREFDRAVHVVRPFPIPQGWTKYRAFDYGLDMLAAYWIAVDESGWAYVYRELCQPGLIISDAARMLREMTAELITATLAPPDMWNRRQETGKSVAEIFAENGVPLIKAQNDRVSGWMEMHEWLKPCIGADGEPGARLRIFESCPGLIEAIPALVFDKKNPSDCDTEPHEFTHGPDAVRYFLAGRPIPAQAAIEPEEDAPDFEAEANSLLEFGM